jgi:hypothetical protein
VRAAIHRLRAGYVATEEIEQHLTSLRGNIGYLAMLNASQARRFELELAELLQRNTAQTEQK